MNILLIIPRTCYIVLGAPPPPPPQACSPAIATALYIVYAL